MSNSWQSRAFLVLASNWRGCNDSKCNQLLSRAGKREKDAGIEQRGGGGRERKQRMEGVWVINHRGEWYSEVDGGRCWGIIQERTVREGEDDIDDEWKTVHAGELLPT